MIKYLGSKRLLLPLITETVTALPGVRTALDLFSGTARVGHALKAAGLQVIANDHNAYAATLARCYVAADAERVRRDAERLLAEFNALPGKAGWFTAIYCEQSRYLQPHNGARVEAIRDAIAAKALEPELASVLLTSLLEAADRVDSTTGVQMAYLKSWSSRSYHPLQLRMPQILPGAGQAHELDALDAARQLQADVAYLDPPYNQHKYLGNYHVWETLVRWDQPEVFGLACKRVDCRTRQSPFNSKVHAKAALSQVISEVRARHVVVSFSDEGFLTRSELETMLASRGHVSMVAREYKRYIGAQIGIHNPAGKKVGKVGHLRNTEWVFVASPDRLSLA